MATGTYAQIASITLGSSASSVTFSSIPQGYRDLVLVMDAYSNVNGSSTMYFNSDTGTNYSTVRAVGLGGSAISSTTSSVSGMQLVSVWTANDSAVAIQQIMDYSSTDKHTTVLSRINDYTNYVAMQAGRWANTAAVTSIKLESDANDFLAGNTFALWGIAA